jgi:hypothetical protein
MAQFDDLEERQAVSFISQILRTSVITCFLKTVFSDEVCMILIMIAPKFVLLLGASDRVLLAMIHGILVILVTPHS